MKFNNFEIGNTIRIFRERMNMTSAELSMVADLSMCHLCKEKRGNNQMPEQNEKKEEKKEENQQETSKETALENTKTEDLIKQSEKIKEKILANLEELERLNDTVTKRIGELDDSIKNSERKIASLNKQVADALAKQNKNDHDMMVSYTLPAGIVVDTTVKKSMSFRKFFDKLCLKKNHIKI